MQHLHRTVFEGDNLEVLREIDSTSIDLIYLDPPFNSNAIYAAPIGSKAAGAAFKDAWTLSDVDLIEHNRLKRESEWLYALIFAAGKSHSKSMFSYLLMMASRLQEMKRILKDTGSIYLHCDPTASHYLKMIMDGIFGKKKYRNVIVWQRHTSLAKGSQHLPKSWGTTTDILLFYANDGAELRPYRPLTQEEEIKQFPLVDEHGERYYNDSAHIWSTPNMGARPNLNYEWRGFVNPHPSGWRLAKERLEEEYQKGNFVIREDGKLERRKYKRDFRGKQVGNLWTDISLPLGEERVGYPTQKPLALLDRIIRASSKEGDMVLDPFCGCATAMVAAELCGRQWCGIDLSSKAAELVVSRIQSQRDLFSFRDIHHRTDVPIRTDISRKTASTASERFQLKNSLYDEQEARCNLCLDEFEDRHLELDHIHPIAKGGKDWIDNFQLLCSNCNRVKRDRTQDEARATIAQRKGINLSVFSAQLR
ncbi:MAG: DNA methyltransferase [Gammaproteobacteria bacterium]|nr:DNA methyltransferase [Gammaproteobacteria bacterium]